MKITVNSLIYLIKLPPSEYCKKIFERQFPNKHFYVVHAHIPDKRPYTFYHIGNVYDPRKNFNKILECFIRLNKPDAND